MVNTIPVAAIIPTFNRGLAVLTVLDRIERCDPRPAETLVHVDVADGVLQAELNRQFPSVRVLTSAIRLGPGGGRHRCLSACSAAYAASFDDDSYPIDRDFFYQVGRLFSEHPRAAIFGANIWHRGEAERVRVDSLIRKPSYIGCGYAVRLAAYSEVRGYLPRRVPYRMEEDDVSIQLFARSWDIYEAGSLRVFHDTDLRHHRSPEITSGVIANVGLFAFLNYPVVGWAWGVLQVANVVIYSLRVGRIRGIGSGILQIPGDCYRNRRFRSPVAWRAMWRFLLFRRTGKV